MTLTVLGIGLAVVSALVVLGVAGMHIARFLLWVNDHAKYRYYVDRH